jgi:hypothetical protein
MKLAYCRVLSDITVTERKLLRNRIFFKLTRFQKVKNNQPYSVRKQRRDLKTVRTLPMIKICIFERKFRTNIVYNK